MKAKEKMVLLGIFLLFSSKSLISYSNQIVINDETIDVSAPSGAGMSAGKDQTIINRGVINVTGNKFTTGMKVDGAGREGINEGVINHVGNGTDTSNAMNAQNGGYVENKKEISVSGKNASGVSADKSGSKGINNGNINVSNSANGMKVTNGAEVINKGIIDVGGAYSTGILAIDSDSRAINEGDIYVSGNSSVGISVTKGSYGENKGNIHVTAGQYTSGMKVDGVGSKGVNSGKIVHIGDGQTSNAMLGQNGGSIENIGIIEVSGTNASGMSIDKAGTELSNKGNIVVTNKAKGIKITGGAKGSNENQIDVQDGTGISVETGSEGLNNGNINVSGDSSTGLLVTDGRVVNNGNIIVTAGEFTSGIKAVGSKAQGINDGTIIHVGNGKTSNAMLAQSGGYIENNNIIQVSGINVSGMAIDGKNSNGVNNKIIIGNKNSMGMKISGGAEGTNKGIISMEGPGSTGMLIGDPKSSGKGINDGEISVEGDRSIGMSLLNGSEGINNGDIFVKAGQYSSAIKADGVGSVGINNGTIAHIGDGQTSNALLAQNNGKVENNGSIQISGVNTSGISASGDGSKGLNNENGKITVFDKALGMKIENNGFGENAGTILNYSTGSAIDVKNGGNALNKGLIENYSTGNGIKVSKGVVTNTGEIKNLGLGNAVLVSDGTFINEGGLIDGGNGVAIRSEVLRKMDPETGKYYDAPTNNSIVLKGGKVKGSIVGGVGVDALFLQGDNNLSDINLENYEILSATGGNSKIDNSFIDLEYNRGNQAYFDENKSKLENDGVITADKGKLEISNSSLVIDFKNSLTDTTLENSIISADKLVLNGDISFSFISGDGRNEFNLSEAFGGVDIELGETGKINSSVIWDYEVKDGNIIAKKNSYGEIVNTGKLSKFVTLLESDRIAKSFAEERSVDKSLLYAVSDAEQLQTSGEFTEAMKQLSGGVYGYMADIAALNSKTLSKKMLDRVIQSDFTRGKATNSSTQDIIYMDNNHRINGLMDVSYKENGILGVTEKQIEENAKIGFMYGGSNGHVKFQGGEYGSASLDNIYMGGYYNYQFTDRFSLTSNARVTTAFNSLKRTINYGNTYGTFDSTFPTYGIGIGTVASYNILKDNYKFGVYGGIDWTKIVQGNITEDPRPTGKPQNELAINNSKTVDEEFYDSVVPKAGVILEKTGYLFGKKYIVGGNVEYETEMGNIKDGKYLKLQGLSQKHKIETTKMENLMSYNIFASLNITEDFSVLGSYASTKSKEYDADSLTVGAKYKFNSIGNSLDTYFDNLAGNKSDRWRGTVNFLLEAEDDSDRVYFDSEGGAFPGDYAASTLYVPKITMSLNDLKSKWSYYFEGYYKDNEMFQGLKSNEAEQHSTRVHLEARWGDTFSRGRYGLNIAYRNETSEKPQNFGKNNFREVKRGVHQIRLTPNFLYNLGNGFALNGNFTSIYEYNHMGDREGQGDFIMENQGGLDYTGLMPRIFMRLNYYKEDRWYDHNHPQNVERYQLSQLRPTFRYYFGNGGNVQLEARFPLGDGGYSNVTRTKEVKSESYESRYSVKYTRPIAPGLTGTIGATLLTVKTKEKSTGMETRYHSFRPMIGVGYSF